MVTHLTFRIADCHEDIDTLLSIDICRDDQKELLATLDHSDWRVALVEGANGSDAWYLLYEDDRPVGAFGWSCVFPKTSAGWFVSDGVGRRRPLEFYKLSKRLMGALSTVYPRIIAAVPEDYERSIRWLKGLGFDIGTTSKQIGDSEFLVATLYNGET